MLHNTQIQDFTRRQIAALKPNQGRTKEQKDWYLRLWTVYAIKGRKTASEAVDKLATVQPGLQPEDYEPFVFLDMGPRGPRVPAIKLFSTYSEAMQVLDGLNENMIKAPTNVQDIVKLHFFFCRDLADIVDNQIKAHPEFSRKRLMNRANTAIYRARSFL